MSFFGNIFTKKDETVSGSAIPPEIYQSVRVMRDDINEIEGKPKEVLPGVSAEADPSQKNNPFLGSEPFASPASPQDQAQGQLVEVGNATTQKEAVTVEKAIKPMNKKLVFGIIAAFLVVIAGVSAYFFLRIKSVQTPASDAPAVSVAEEPIDVPDAPTSEFSLENPNYLMLDPESDASTPEGIAMKLSDTAEKVKAMSPAGPVEFLVRDANGNPIAFSRLSYLMKLGIPEDALSALDETFSLYVVLDGGEPRFAVALEVKEEKLLADSVAKEESALPAWFRLLLYPSSVEAPASASFRAGTYGTIGTKFALIDAEKNYSFDYALTGKKWIIGTSKDSFRAALERVVIGGAK